jgi:predicted HTH transcriptional regulator
MHAQTAEFLAIADLSSGGQSSSPSTAKEAAKKKKMAKKKKSTAKDLVRLAAPLSSNAINKYLDVLIHEGMVSAIIC